jgi:hypothetical protein
MDWKINRYILITEILKQLWTICTWRNHVCGLFPLPYVFFSKQCFGNWICFCLQVKRRLPILCWVPYKESLTDNSFWLFLRDPTEYGPPSFDLKSETDPVSETLFKKNIGWWTKSINMIPSSAIHHRQNRLELIWIMYLKCKNVSIHVDSSSFTEQSGRCLCLNYSMFWNRRMTQVAGQGYDQSGT